MQQKPDKMQQGAHRFPVFNGGDVSEKHEGSPRALRFSDRKRFSARTYFNWGSMVFSQSVSPALKVRLPWGSAKVHLLADSHWWHRRKGTVRQQSTISSALDPKQRAAGAAVWHCQAWCKSTQFFFCALILLFLFFWMTILLEVFYFYTWPDGRISEPERKAWFQTVSVAISRKGNISGWTLASENWVPTCFKHFCSHFHPFT